MIEISILKKVDLEGYTFIEGFPGVGLVGPMTISYLINKLELEYIGYVNGDIFPPLVSIHEDMPMPPSRFYYSKKYKIITLFAESGTVSEKGIYELSNKIYDFIKSNKIASIISINGVPVEKPDGESAFAVASTKKSLEKIASVNLKTIGEGVAAGVSALLLMYSSLDNLDDINLLIPVDQQIIDPRYAEIAIKSLNKILGLNIDVDELEKEAVAVEERIKDVLKKSKESKESILKGGDSGPSMYA
jgi:uncharacterized protein